MTVGDPTETYPTRCPTSPRASRRPALVIPVIFVLLVLGCDLGSLTDPEGEEDAPQGCFPVFNCGSGSSVEVFNSAGVLIDVNWGRSCQSFSSIIDPGSCDKVSVSPGSSVLVVSCCNTAGECSNSDPKVEFPVSHAGGATERIVVDAGTCPPREDPRPTTLVRKGRLQHSVTRVPGAFVVESNRFTVTLLDQFGKPMQGVRITESVEIDFSNSHPRSVLPFVLVGSGPTDSRGQFEDGYKVTIFSMRRSLPRNTSIRVLQAINARGLAAANVITITDERFSDSYPLTFQ